MAKLATAALMLVSASAADEIVSLHGAGTTNPSKLFWEAMDLITARARLPLHMTYRAVGSSTGQKEFVGSENGFKEWNDFGAGDIPMTSSRYQEVVDSGRTMIHVPFAMGGIAVFHSVPEGNLPESGELDLDACLLARIFSRDITTWDHPDIVAKNPDLTYIGDIKVVHRVKGSSSTAGFTQYIEATCPASWSLGSGSTIVWPEGTFEGQGSGGMSSFISSNEGAIGYIDAGHGHDVGLGEIALQNKDGVYLTTKTADIGAAGTIALSASPSRIPTDPTADFSGVNLYDLEGPTTWPITMITYFYLNKNLTALEPETAGLLVYFINFLLGEEGQALAETKYKFVKLPPNLVTYNAQSMGSLMLPAGTPTFSSETSTMPQTGAGKYMISVKRRSYLEYITDKNTGAIDELKAEEVERLSPTDRLEELGPEAIAALVIGCVGILLAFVSFLMACVLCCNKRETKSLSVARDLSPPPKTGDAV